MDITEKERLARYRDTSDEAISVRLRAARRVTGLQQKQLAQQLGINKNTYHSQESKGRPSIDVMRWFYRNHLMDFNYFLNGDLQQMPRPLQDELLAALAGGERATATPDS